MYTELASVHCPYCGEPIELVIDPSGVEPAAVGSDYVEDCSVCCRPMVVSVWHDGRGELAVAARREDE